MTESKNRQKNIPVVCVLIILTSLMIRQLIVGFMDNDFYHIAVSGRRIEQNGIFYENPYFVESGYHMIVQQWLYAIALYLSYAWAGFSGVFLFTALQAILLLILSWLYLRIRNCDTYVTRIGAVLMVLSVQDLCCRPEIISICLLVLQLILLELYRANKKVAVLYLLPLLSLAEINLHASYAVFHLIFLLPYLVPVHKLSVIGEMENMVGIKADPMPVKPLILPMILMSASFLLNPYGLESFLMVAKSGNIRLIPIAESQPVSIMKPQSAFLLIGVILIGIAIGLKRLKQSTLMMGLGILLITLIAVKNSLFWSIVLLAVCGDLLDGQDCRVFWELLEIKKKILQILLPVLSVVAGILLITIQGWIRWERSPEGLLIANSGLEVQEKDSEICPLLAVDYILANETHPEEVRIMNSFNNGSYFLWRGIGHVYIEPKTEPYLRSINGKFDVVSEYAYLLSFATFDEIDAIVKKYDFDYICASMNMPALQTYLQQTNEYQKVLESESTYDGYVAELGRSVPEYVLYRKCE